MSLARALVSPIARAVAQPITGGPAGGETEYSLRLNFVSGFYEVTRVDGTILRLDFANGFYVVRN